MTIPAVIAADPYAGFSVPMRWLLERCSPADEAAVLLSPHQSLETLYGVWSSRQYLAETIRMIAGVLPARESIWWAWVSARYGTQAEGGKPATAQVHQALTAIEQWIVRPEDSSRRAAWAAGNAAGMDTPVGMISAAVFLSGTSVAPPGSPAAPPPPDAGMPLVAGSILLASTSGRADQVTPTLVAFAAQGTEIIRRLGGWDAALKVAYETHQRQLSEYERATAPQKES